MTCIGIDAAKWQGILPVDDLWPNGIKFAIVKATHGLSRDADVQFKRSFARLQTSNVLRSAYHWFTDADPVAQADAFLYTVGDLRSLGDLPLAVDFEEPATRFRGKELLDRLRLCLERVEAVSGRRVILYSGKWYWDQFVGNDVEAQDLVERYLYWHAEYPRTMIRDIRACGMEPPVLGAPKLPMPWQRAKVPYFLWQFDGNGGCVLPNGVDADFNVFAGSFEELANIGACNASTAVNTLLSNFPYELLVAEDFARSLAALSL